LNDDGPGLFDTITKGFEDIFVGGNNAEDKSTGDPIEEDDKITTNPPDDSE
jgi:hypothetical protein